MPAIGTLMRGLALLLAAGWTPAVSGAILIEPGSNVQRIISQSPAGSDFVLAAGVHYAERIRLRSGDSVSGAPGAELVGSFWLRNVSDVEIRELRMRSQTADCIHVESGTSIRLRASEIGPCQGNGILAWNSSGVLITDNYIHPENPVRQCCDNGDGVYAREVRDIRIAGNVIAFGEANVELQRVTGAEVVGNYLLNPLGPYPRGQHVQIYDSSHDVTIEGNALESNDDPSLPFQQKQEDAINAGQSSNIRISGNFIEGGASPSGCGIIADDGAHDMSIVDNVLWHTGQCGIGIASGGDHQIVGNKIRNWYVEHPGAGNTAIYVWQQYAGKCGPVRISGNIAYARKPDGEASSFWKGGPQCDPVVLAQNVFGEAARRQLPDEALESLRPGVPPQPQECVAPSPFSDKLVRPPCLREPESEETIFVPMRARTRTRKTP